MLDPGLYARVEIKNDPSGVTDGSQGLMRA